MIRLLARRSSAWFWSACVFLFTVCPGLRAQNSPPIFDATQLHEPRQLDMTWRVQAGDDSAFARADFDDSHWQSFDPTRSITQLYGSARPQVIWYRLHLQVDPAAKGLALDEVLISRAFEIYVNGERLIASGSVKPFVPYTSAARLLAAIPDRMTATGSLVIAQRVHIAPTEWVGQMPGYYAANLQLGQYNTLRQQDWLTILGENALGWVDRLSLILLGLVAFVLFAAQPRQAEYRWIAALGILTLVQTPEPILTLFRNIPEFWELINTLPRLASPFIWASLYFSFVQQRIGWRWRAFLIFAGVCNALAGVQTYLFTSPAFFQLFGNFPFVILLTVIVPIVLAIHWRKGNREAGILLIPAVLFSIYIYIQIALGTMFQFPSSRATALHWFMLIQHYEVGPLVIPLQYVCSILSTTALAIIMLQRAITMSERQAQLDTELEAAQQVQKVLVPEKIGSVPGFTVESVYQPAQQVGGDFFQILPDHEGGLLVVLGDVAGKGLPAAMLVSVLVGALRATAEYTHDPAELLTKLNERLVDRAGGAFATALAAHMSATGWVTIANAGHLSPYLDGREIALPGALPLGVAAETTYEITDFFLAPNSRLTFYSDGVVEAQNAAGELLGFERSRLLSVKPASDIVEAARQFGQQDDITVVAVERIGVEIAVA